VQEHHSSNRHILDCMRQMGYQSYKAEADLRTKAVLRPDDGTKYYSYPLPMLMIVFGFTMMKGEHSKSWRSI